MIENWMIEQIRTIIEHYKNMDLIIYKKSKEIYISNCENYKVYSWKKNNLKFILESRKLKTCII